MHTEYWLVDKEHPDEKRIQQGARLLRENRLVAFPTETVYGLGANGLSAEAVEAIYRAKGRPSDNPLILHIAHPEELTSLVTEIPPNAKALIDAYWPGPLTIVLKRTEIVPDQVAGGLDTVAVRLPDSIVARALIAQAGVPIAAPSANLSGRPSPTSAQAVLADLDGRIDAILDAGHCDIGLESTVVDCTTLVPTLLRPGGITVEMLIDTVGAVEIDPTLGGHAECAPRSPGMKYTHYAPTAPMTLIEGGYPQIADRMVEQINAALAEGKTVGVIASSETAGRLPNSVISAVYGSRQQVPEIATRLYTALRSFDSTSVDVIFAEGIDEQGLGLAIMNRLRKASGYRIIKA